VEALKTALEGTYAMTSDERCKVLPFTPLYHYFLCIFGEKKMILYY
jgi:hypothetical protein